MFTLVIFLTTTPVSAGIADIDFGAIDNFVESQIRELRISGLALAIVQGNRIVHLQGFGVADPGGHPVTPQTPFMIGSMTKSFTALAVMQLVEQGKIDLDAPVQRYIPWFRVADPASSSQITVRHLLNQTSGISTAGGNGDLTRDDTTDDALQQRARALQSVHLSQPAGATFQYANYDLLGLLVEMVSGQSYENYVQEQIFSPLDMHHSATSPAAAQADGLAVGYHYWFGIPAAMKTPFPRGSLPSGYLISSAEDLLTLRIKLNCGLIGRMAKKASKSWKEERRKRAWVLYQAGWPQKQIAAAMGVTKGAVSQWIKAAQEGGEAALAARKSTGSPRRLSTEERQRIPGLLERGAESFGFRGDLWTCPRVAKVIERELGVKYHPAHVSRILKELGWTPQKPMRRAKQRKEAEIQR